MADKNHAEEAKEEAATERGATNRRKPNVCRKLDFGGDSNDKGLNDPMALSEEDLEQHRQRAIEKWNFDFENEVPLEGDWQWEKVPVEHPDVKEVICTMESKYQGNRTV